MDLALVILSEILYAVALLVLISAGLAVVFGMMRVINLAHGEFLTLGSYATIVAHQQGLNIYLAMLIAAPLTTAIWGLLVERVLIRLFYGRLINTMLATWGLSLVMAGAFTMIFGTTTTGVSAPIEAFTVGAYQMSGYNLFVILIAACLMVLIYAALRGTRWGLIARGTMQDAQMSAAFGYHTPRVYMLTFVAGAALTGLAGGVLAPLVGVGPFSGTNYIAKAFITVISGGTALVSGTLASAGIFGVVSQTFTLLITPVIGEIALLVMAVILLRLLPTGISGRFLKNKL